MPTEMERRCIVLTSAVIAFEIALMCDPQNVQVDLFYLMQLPFFFKSFYCPCGSIHGHEGPMIQHRRLLHKKQAILHRNLTDLAHTFCGQGSQWRIRNLAFKDYRACFAAACPFEQPEREKTVYELIKLSICFNSRLTMHIPLTVDASVIDKSYDKPYLHHNKQNLKI